MKWLKNFFKKNIKDDYTLNASDQQRDLQYLTELRNQIDLCDLEADTIENIQVLIEKFTKRQPKWKLKIKSGIFFRVVNYKEKPKSFLEVIYPPSQFAKLNRANQNGECMFYGSLNLPTALMEIGIEKDDYFVMSKWRIVDPIILGNLGYSNTTITDKRPLPAWIDKTHQKFDNKVSSFVSDYIAEKFAQKVDASCTNIYKLTNAIAKALLKNEDLEGIMYPSIKLDGINDNIVLRPIAIHSNKLEIINIQWMKILDVFYDENGARYVFEHLDICTHIDNDGTLNWKLRPGQFENVPFSFTTIEPGGDLVCKDDDGVIYERS